MYLFLLSFHNDYIIDLRDVCVHLLQFAFNFIFYFSRPCLFNINFWMCKTLACFPDSKLYIKLYWDRHHCGKLVIYLKEMWLILLMLKSSLFYSSNYFSLIKHTSQEFKGSKSLFWFLQPLKFFCTVENWKQNWFTDGASTRYFVTCPLLVPLFVYLGDWVPWFRTLLLPVWLFFLSPTPL